MGVTEISQAYHHLLINGRRGGGRSYGGVVVVTGQAIVAAVFLEPLRLGHQGSLEYNPPLLVLLRLVGGVLIHPAEFGLALLARDVAHHVTASEHDAILHFAVLQIDYFVEEERSARRPRESRRHQLRTICQERVTVGTREQARASQMLQK